MIKNVNIREIDNGWIVTVVRESKDGEEELETFYKSWGEVVQHVAEQYES